MNQPLRLVLVLHNHQPIGNFDGVHLGHRVLIKRVRELAVQKEASEAAVLTFEPHPREFLGIRPIPERLCSLEEKKRRIKLLGIDKVTVVGHSFGGGVAMQFAYQFPERTERLILVASGGLGAEVSPGIRMLTAPGFHQVMGLLTLPGVRHVGKAGLKALSRTGLKATRDLDEVAEIYDSFRDPFARAAIRHVVRAVVDWRGQIVTMADRAYLTEEMPMAVIWGRDDRVIPVRHASNAAALAPKARVEVIPNAGHFPHKDHPQRFARIVHDFVRSTPPATYSRTRFRSLLKNGRTTSLSPIRAVRDASA